METTASFDSPRRTSGVSDPMAIGIGSLSLAALVGLDYLLGVDVGIEGTFIIAPLLAALLGSVRATAIVTAMAVPAALVLGLGQTHAEEALVKGSLVALAGAGALLLAVRQRQTRRKAAEQALLEGIAGTVDRDTSIQESVETILQLLVEWFASGCSLSVSEQEGEERVLAQAGSVEIPHTVAGRWSDEHGLARDWDPATLRLSMNTRGKILGSLTLTQEKGFSAENAKFAQRVADRVAVALDHAGLFDEFDSLSGRLDNVLALVDEAVFISTPEGRPLFANEAGRRFLGLEGRTEDSLNAWTRAARNVHVETESGNRVGNLASAVKFWLRKGESWSGTLRLVDARSRSERWVVAKAKPVRASSGEPLYMVFTVEDITEIKGRETTQRLLAEISSRLTEGVGLRVSLQSIAETCVPGFADSCSVLVPNQGQYLEILGLAHRDPARLELMREYNSRNQISMEDHLKVVESQKSGRSIIFDLDDEMIRSTARSPADAETLREIGNESGLIVPLRNGSENLGVLAFGNGHQSRVFRRADQEVAEVIADRCAELIKRERFAEESLEIAKILELDLRPDSLPLMQGLRSAEVFESSTRLSQIGGDFYEGFESGGYWNLVIGDVVGRGAAAAALTLEARDTLRVALEMSGSPEAAMSQLDRRLISRGRGEQVSVALVRIRSDDPSKVLVTSAGHPAPIFAIEGGMSELGESGPILGLGISGGWPETAIDWSDDSVLVLYTDGVTEVRNAGKFFGSEGIARAVAKGTDVEQMAEVLFDELSEFAGGRIELTDDMAAVFLAKNGDSSQPPARMA